jgi:hypothetical protein
MANTGTISSERIASLAVAGFMALALTGVAVSAPVRPPTRPLTLTGTVAALNGQKLAYYKVSLYASSVSETPWRRSSSHWSLLGSATTDRSGSFKITYALPAAPDNKPAQWPMKASVPPGSSRPVAPPRPDSRWTSLP